jgi:hypothetical protein
MSIETKAFVVGFTNAFNQIDYTDSKKLGNITNKLQQSFSQIKQATHEQINKQISQISKTK